VCGEVGALKNKRCGLERKREFYMGNICREIYGNPGVKMMLGRR